MIEKYWLVALLILSIIAIIVGTSKYKILPFLVLSGTSYFVALSAEMIAVVTA